MFTRSGSALSCLVGAFAYLSVVLTSPGCTDGDGATAEARVVVTTPDGATHDTFGSRAELVESMTGALPAAITVDGTSTTDPTFLSTGQHIEVALVDGRSVRLEREGDGLALYYDRPTAGAHFVFDPDQAGLTIDLEGRTFQVDATGVRPEERAAFLGGVLYRFIVGHGLEQIAGIDEAHAFWVVFIILIEVGILISQISNYASMSECRANQPGRCQGDAARACAAAGYSWAGASWSCVCGWACAFGLGSVEASCDITCGNTEEEARNPTGAPPVRQPAQEAP